MGQKEKRNARNILAIIRFVALKASTHYCNGVWFWKMDAPKEWPIVGSQFHTYRALPLPLTRQGISFNGWNGTPPLSFQRYQSKSAKRPLSTVLVIGHAMPCPLGISLTCWVCECAHIRIWCPLCVLVCLLHVFICMKNARNVCVKA